MTDEYKNEIVPRAIRVFDSYYKENGGPYLLGDKVTYADFAVYQILDNDNCTGAKPVCDFLCGVRLVPTRD